MPVSDLFLLAVGELARPQRVGKPEGANGLVVVRSVGGNVDVEDRLCISCMRQKK